MTFNCRHCGAPLTHEVIDLGHQPPSNAYLKKEDLYLPEVSYPLKAYVCTHCWLMQLPAHATAKQLFTDDYAYFSSTSISWCEHAREFVEKAVERLKLDKKSYVVELASNDGYLLQYVNAKGIKCLGIEPTHAAAQESQNKGIETLEAFFGVKLANKMQKADLIVANNVLAHVPDINDFIEGISIVLKEKGMASIEFPHILNLLEKNQFDTIYHEHYSYLGLKIVNRIASKFGLEAIDVEELKTHGGSLRVWLAHKNEYEKTNNIEKVENKEDQAQIETINAYQGFQHRAEQIKYELIEFLLECKANSRKIAGYGAAAKGNTLLNYAGIKSDLLPIVADLSPMKQNKFLPGSHIPVVDPIELVKQGYKQLLVLPWNLIEELKNQLPNNRLVTAIPEFKIWETNILRKN